MQKVLSAEEMREIDRLTTEKYGIPSLLLMENAAHAAARVIAEKLGGSVGGKSFLILCGKGNNGGDGAALARILWTQGANVDVYLFGKVEETKGDARVNFEILKSLEEKRDGLKSRQLVRTAGSPKIKENNFFSFEETSSGRTSELWTENVGFDDFDFIIDALFGTGLTRSLTTDFKNVFKQLKDQIDWSKVKPKVFSIDIPSGLNADLSEQIGETIRADLTVTFTAPKAANVLPPASNFNGELIVANIGSPRELIDAASSRTFLAEKEDALDWLEKTEFASASYKNKRGHALLVAGSDKYAGAAILAGNASIVSGVGLTTIATSASAQNSIASRVLPEVMTRGVRETDTGAAAEEAFDEIMEFVESSIDAVALGSGLGTDESTKRLIRRLVEERRTPAVIDADALTALAPYETKGNDENPLILTPHAGEFLKLLGTEDNDAAKDRVRAAREFAEKHHVILVMKGERSLIAAPDGRVVVIPKGNSGLGKAGNGDTLAGVIVGFAAQAVQMKVEMFETVVAAVYLSALAGDIAAEKYGKRSMLATDVRECLRDAFERIRN